MINRIFNSATASSNSRMLLSRDAMEALGIAEGEDINGVNVYSSQEEIKPKQNPQFPISRLHKAIEEEQQSDKGLGINLLNPNDSGIEIANESHYNQLMNEIAFSKLTGLDPRRN